MALINLRNALMAGKRLPYDAEVEFLESVNNNQWVDTGVVCQGDYEVAVGIMANVTTGEYFTSNGNLGIRLFNYQSRLYLDQNRTASATGPDRIIGPTGSFKVNVQYDIRFGNQYAYIDGVLIESKASVTIASATSLLVLQRPCRVYYLKIFLGGVLVRDYIPVRKGTVGYLYDRVSGKLFGNAGTGDFVVGPDKS